MAENSLLAHGLKFIDRMEQERTRRPSGNVWFKWDDKDEHVIRLVGDFLVARMHWIGKSKFSDVQLLKDSAFQGENKLNGMVACANWDFESETEADNGCPVCRIARNISAILKEEKGSIDKEDEARLVAIRKLCNFREQFLYKCIDRDNPWIDNEKTVKGFKVITMDRNLFHKVVDFNRQFPDIQINAENNGIDIVIKRSKGAKGMEYTVNPVYKGMSVIQSSLSEEEKAFDELDLRNFVGRPVDAARFVSELSDDSIRDIYNSNGALRQDSQPDDSPF